MTDAELVEVRHCIELATATGRARHEQLMKAVTLLTEMADEHALTDDQSLVLLQAAQRLLS